MTTKLDNSKLCLVDQLNLLVLSEERGKEKPGDEMCLVDRLNSLLVKKEEAPEESARKSQTDDRFSFVIEVYDFDASLKTKDLMFEFKKDYGPCDFRLKWVDDTHALGLFATSKQAWLASKAPYTRFKTRLLKDGTPQSKEMAKKLADKLQPQGKENPLCTDKLQPQGKENPVCTDKLRPSSQGREDPDKDKPKTTAIVARRMVASALGVKVRVSEEQKEKEKRELQAARDRKQAKKAHTAKLC